VPAADNLITIMCRSSRNSGRLVFSEAQRSVQDRNGIAFNTHIDTSTLPEVFDTALHIRRHIFPAVYLTCSGRPVITTLQKKKNVLSNILVIDQPFHKISDNTCISI
jgi:hypothetical protein